MLLIWNMLLALNCLNVHCKNDKTSQFRMENYNQKYVNGIPIRGARVRVTPHVCDTGHRTRSENMIWFSVTALSGLVTLTPDLSNYKWGHCPRVTRVYGLPSCRFSASRLKVMYGTGRQTTAISALCPTLWGAIITKKEPKSFYVRWNRRSGMSWLELYN